MCIRDRAGSVSQRPNLMPILDILEEKGDEIFAEADSVVVEVDIDKEIVKKVIQLCEKYDKKLYGVISNMSIAIERRDFLQKFDCFICNLEEAGIFFTDDYSEKTPAEMEKILAAVWRKPTLIPWSSRWAATEPFTRNEVERAASALPERFRSGIPPEPVIPSVPASSAA